MSKKYLILIIILGIALTIGSFLAQHFFKLGDFNMITGRNDLPRGFPFEFLQKGSWDGKYKGALPPVGSQPAPQFHAASLMLDLIFWTIVSALIIFLVKYIHRKIKK